MNRTIAIAFSEGFPRTISASPSMRRDSGAGLGPDYILLSTHVGRTALLYHTRMFHTLTMQSPLSYCPTNIASHSRDLPHLTGPFLTSPPLYPSPGDGWSVFTYRRSVWRLSRSTSSWFNEKVDCVTRRQTKN